MPLWKKLLLRSAGFGAGFALALCAVAAVWAYYQSRPHPPKPWDKQSVTAEYDGISVDRDHNYLSFEYILQNNTESDYRLESATAVDISVKLKDQRSFAQFGGLKESLQFPIFVPAKRRVRLSLTIPYAYPINLPNKQSRDEKRTFDDAVAEYVRTELRNLDGFVLFDGLERYEIDFPNGWRKGN